MSVHDNYRLCKNYLNRDVQIVTTSGMIYRGTITKVDSRHVYLLGSPYGRSGNRGHISAFFGAPFIIPLVLFDLLAIALL